jgi:hypothetical protein
MRRIGVFAFAWVIVHAATAVAMERIITFTPAPGEHQTVQTVRGHPATSSTLATSGVTLILTTEKIDGYAGPVFLLGAKSIAPSPTRIEAKQVSATSDAGPVDMLTFEELEAVARAQSSGMRQSGMGRAAMARLPGSPYVREDYNRTMADRRVSGAQAEMADAEELRREAGWAAETMGFKPLQLEPGQTVFGPVSFGRIPDKATRLDIAVEVNGETHHFVYGVAHTTR